MRPDLMSSSCNQSYLQKCCPSIAAKRCVHSLYRLGILNFIFIYSNLVASGVFFLKLAPGYASVPFKHTFYDTKIILMDGPVMKKL